MRKKANKLLALLTAVAITVTGVNVPANNASAASVKLSAKKVTLTAGKKKTIYLKKGKKKLAIKSVKSSKKKVATVKKSGKKIVITAKKKGTATITVKAKVNKKVKSFKCKVTVKAKAKATSAPSASASTAPASQAPASQAPSAATDVSAAPSADPSAVPSADVSASPSADVSAEPSVEPSKEPSKATEIKFLNDVALTNTAGTKAYVYYDVLDQYGESMRTSVDIQWTTSPANGKADKATGRIEIPAATDKFTYGQQIFVVGVNAKYGLTENKSFTIGMAQAVDTIKIAGFVSKNDTTKILETLPENFSADTYYMLFTTFDQNGNPLDVTDDEYGAKNLSIISGAPLTLDFDKNQTKTFTVKGDDYAGILVKPGTYVDRGGEVTITVIATKTGTKKEETIVIGETPQLKSLELLAPSKTVADGDQNVEIPFKALDTKGNEVTAYETLVRSSNTLSLNASEGTLKLAEQDDGTAKITWSDKYDPTAAALYKESIASDGFARPVNLMSIVIGGESIPTQLSVEDARIPTTISATNLPDYIANGDQLRSNPTGHSATSDMGTWMPVFAYKDQYNTALAADKVNAFFAVAASTTGFNDKKYGVKMIVPTNDVLGLTTGVKLHSTKFNEKWEETGEADINSLNWGSDLIFGEADLSDTDDNFVEETLKFSIVTKSGSNDWSDESKIVSHTITSVKVKAMGDFSISGVSDVNEVSAVENSNSTRSAVGTDTKKALTVESADFVSAPKIGVKGKYKGNSITVPFNRGYIAEGTGSRFTVQDGAILDDKGKKNDTEGSKAIGNLKTSTTIDGKTVNVTSENLFDYKTYGNPAKNAIFELAVAIRNEDTTVTAAELAELQTNAATLADAKKILENAVKDVADVATSGAVTPATSAAITAKEAYEDLTDYTDDDAVDAVVEAYNTVKTKDAALATLVKAVTDAIADVVTAAKAEKALADAEKTLTTVRADVTVSAEVAETTKLDFKTEATVNPTDTKISGILPTATAKSQYGKDTTETIVYTISDYKEADGALTHKVGGVEISDNGSAAPSIVGAEIGDTFKVTAKVQGKAISAECTVTVGADKSAFIGYGTGNDNSDKTFRETYLGYVKK